MWQSFSPPLSRYCSSLVGTCALDYNSRYVIRHILCIGITQIIIQFTNGAGIKYETMSFNAPPKDIFLASVLIGSLGAVMDVAITISSGMYEILQRTPNISLSRWALAGRNIDRILWVQ